MIKYKLTKKKFFIFLIALIIGIIIILVSLKPFIIPVIKFIAPYDISDNMTAEETIELFFECAKDNNPGKANKLLRDPILDIFSCNSIKSLELISIEKVGNDRELEDANDFYDTQEFLVTYKCYQRWYDGHKLFAAGENQSATIMHMVKEDSDSAWKILSWTG